MNTSGKTLPYKRAYNLKFMHKKIYFEALSTLSIRRKRTTNSQVHGLQFYNILGTMGWLWSSASSKEGQLGDNASNSTTPKAAETSPQPPSSTPQTKTLSRDEQAELELKNLIAEFQETGDSDTKHSQPPENASSSQPRTSVQTPEKPPSADPDSLYQDSMSCRSAFDYAFFCQSFGGQWVNVYRYGELRSCSELWGDFWLCMRSRSYPEEEKKEIFRNHYRKKAIKYKTGPSSEDIWDVRTEPPKGAFQGDFAALERQMEEEEAASQTI